MRINEDFLNEVPENNFENKNIFEFSNVPFETFGIERLRYKLNNLSDIELKRLEVNYRSNGNYNQLCPLSDEIEVTNYDVKPYSLFGSSYLDTFVNENGNIFEGLVKTLEPEKVVKLFGSDDLNKIMHSDEFLKDLKVNPYNASSQICDFLPINEFQICINEKNDGITYITISIPDLDINRKCIDMAMNAFGYFKSKEDYDESFDIISINNVKWVSLQYEPKYQPLVTEHIKKNYEYLYHLCPAKYAKKIMAKGLVPYSKHASYDYPGRNYLLVPARKDNNKNLIRSVTVHGMRNLSAGLNRKKLNREENSYVDDNIWMTLRIDVSKLQKNIEFSYDENCYPLGIFTYDNIRPNAIEIIDAYRFLEPQKRKGAMKDIPIEDVLK